MNILAIDYGQKRIGLAWCQTGVDVVFPFGIIKEKDEQARCQAIATRIKEERIDKVVMGMPISVEDGTDKNINSTRVKEFATFLQSYISIPIEFVDERFSSQQADSMGGIASRDEKAAMVILETYKQRYL